MSTCILVHACFILKHAKLFCFHVRQSWKCWRRPWIDVSVYSLNQAASWFDVSVHSPNRAASWFDVSVYLPNRAASWIDVSVHSPNRAASWFDVSVYSPNRAASWFDFSVHSPNRAASSLRTCVVGTDQSVTILGSKAQAQSQWRRQKSQVLIWSARWLDAEMCQSAARCCLVTIKACHVHGCSCSCLTTSEMVRAPAAFGASRQWNTKT